MFLIPAERQESGQDALFAARRQDMFRRPGRCPGFTVLSCFADERAVFLVRRIDLRVVIHFALKKPGCFGKSGLLFA